MSFLCLHLSGAYLLVPTLQFEKWEVWVEQSLPSLGKDPHVSGCSSQFGW